MRNKNRVQDVSSYDSDLERFGRRRCSRGERVGKNRDEGNDRLKSRVDEKGKKKVECDAIETSDSDDSTNDGEKVIGKGRVRKPKNEGLLDEFLEASTTDGSESDENGLPNNCFRDVEVKMNMTYYKKVPHIIYKVGNKVPRIVPCIQQVPDSVDCGVAVCFNIENEVKHCISNKRVLTNNAAAEYQKKMVEWFMDLINMDIDSQ